MVMMMMMMVLMSRHGLMSNHRTSTFCTSSRALCTCTRCAAGPPPTTVCRSRSTLSITTLR